MNSTSCESVPPVHCCAIEVQQSFQHAFLVCKPYHSLQIFLTANPKLRSEVARQFHKLRAAVLHDPAEARRLEELASQDYATLDNIPSEAFPLFWTTKQYLRAADATLIKPFFPRFASYGVLIAWNHCLLCNDHVSCENRPEICLVRHAR